MEITIKRGSKVHNIKVGQPEAVKKVTSRAKELFKKSRGEKKPKASDLLISTLKTLGDGLERIEKKLEQRSNSE